MTEKRTTRKRKTPADIAAAIVDASLEEAAAVGWDAVQLTDVGARLGLSLADIERHFRDKDAIANALFDRAWQAMLAPPAEDFAALPARERLFQTMMRWFDALAPHRVVAADMIQAKLYPSHPHHWVPMVFNLSRTIHWLLDAAQVRSSGRRRQIEEIGLSGLFLSVLWVWMRDGSEGQADTRAVLARRLDNADRLMARLFR